MASTLSATVKFSASITVACPGCRTIIYQGPALTEDFTEVYAIGDTFTCTGCSAEIRLESESL